LYFSHHSSSKALSVIFLSMNTHQGKPLVRPFFALFIFLFCVVFQGFSLHVSSLP
jgi:hypothetical protein